MTEETALKLQVKDYLKIKGYFWWYNLAGMGAFKGIPDICVAGPKGLYLVEFKAPSGKLSDHQESFKAKIIEIY